MTGHAATFYKECDVIERLIAGDDGSGAAAAADNGAAAAAAAAAAWEVDDSEMMAALDEKEKIIAAKFEAEMSMCKEAAAGGSGCSSAEGSMFLTET